MIGPSTERVAGEVFLAEGGALPRDHRQGAGQTLISQGSRGDGVKADVESAQEGARQEPCREDFSKPWKTCPVFSSEKLEATNEFYNIEQHVPGHHKSCAFQTQK